jgi:hypothetical protein
MELKYVIPSMEKTFGNLEYAEEGKVEQRRINGRMTTLSCSYNLYSEMSKGRMILRSFSLTKLRKIFRA